MKPLKRILNKLFKGNPPPPILRAKRITPAARQNIRAVGAIIIEHPCSRCGYLCPTAPSAQELIKNGAEIVCDDCWSAELKSMEARGQAWMDDRTPEMKEEARQLQIRRGLRGRNN